MLQAPEFITRGYHRSAITLVLRTRGPKLRLASIIGVENVLARHSPEPCLRGGWMAVGLTPTQLVVEPRTTVGCPG